MILLDQFLCKIFGHKLPDYVCKGQELISLGFTYVNVNEKKITNEDNVSVDVVWRICKRCRKIETFTIEDPVKMYEEKI